MYNLLGELCVCILAFILIINTVTSFYLGDRRNLWFFLCASLGFFAPFTNILSIKCITSFPDCSVTYATFIAEVYFLLIGLQMMTYAFYCYAFVSPSKKHKKQFYCFLAVPFIIYSLIVLMNIKTGWIFHYDPVNGYTRGPLKFITYATSSIYIATVIVTIIIHRKITSRRIFTVFLAYPIICISITAIQFFSPYNVMTGLASFAPLILMYFGVQSEQIAHDFATGAFTEKQLPNFFKNKSHGYCLTVISIENYDAYLRDFKQIETDKMMLLLTKDLSRTYGRKIFRLTKKLAVLTRTLDEVKETINGFMEHQKHEKNFRVTPELISASVCIPENAETYEQATEILQQLLMKNRGAEIKYSYCDDIFVAQEKRKHAICQILDRELHADSKQFQVFFQPIYSIAEKKFKYSEALSRMKGTELGDISPAEFIPIAETYGYIERLGQVTFEKICRFISENKSTVNAVSVNFSVHQMSNPSIVDTVLNTIKKYNIRPQNIIMEITESIFIESFEAIRLRMEQLAKEGIIFYLDDFGTGFSNFANVITLPFSTIKIDRSFVLMMEKSEKMSSLVNSLIKTFKDNGLKILVEGVETENQDSLVKKAGTDYIQGFLYERPLPASEVIEIFKKQ